MAKRKASAQKNPRLHTYFYFLGAFAIILSAMIIYQGNVIIESKILERDAERTMSFLSREERPIAFLGEAKYAELKKEMGVRSEIAVYFEDSEGNIMALSEGNCFGSSAIKVNGEPCRE